MDRFIIVDSHNSEYIGIIFHILRKCGYNMALTKRYFIGFLLIQNGISEETAQN